MTIFNPTLQWVTTAESIANLYIGSEFSESVLAFNPINSQDQISYQLIGGSLPDGITLNLSGLLSGLSTTTDTYFTTRTYNFIVRASSSNSIPADRSFSLIVSNKVNSDFNWVTPAGSLGTVPSGTFYQLPLVVSESSSNVTTTFSFVSGELPPGMEVNSTEGYLQGVPTLLNAVAVNSSENFRFTIRATNSLGHLRDRAFSLNVTNVNGPIIEPSTTKLGSVFDGTYYYQQLTVNELNPNVSITWTSIGNLPPGVTLSSTGLLSGYIQPSQLVGIYGPAGYDGGTISNSIGVSQLIPGVVYQILSIGTTDFTTLGATNNYVGAIFTALSTGTGTGTVTEYNTIVTAGYLIPGVTYQIKSIGNSDFTGNGALTNHVGTIFTANSVGAGTGVVSQYIQSGITQQQEYDFGPYDFSELSLSVTYSFTIRAFDGANYDLQNYVINVVSRSGYTADNTFVTADISSLTTDIGNVYIPVILNANITTLPTGRSNSYYAYKLEGYDFQGDAVTFSIPNSAGTFDAVIPGIDNGFDYGSTDTGNPGDNHSAGVPFDSYIQGSSGSSNLPGVSLDANTGWIYGLISNQSEAYQTYTFGVIVSKTRGNLQYSSQPIYFTLPVLGDVNNIIEWISPSDLGSINNGAVSEITLEAKSIAGKPLVYSLVDAQHVTVRLPQGLNLLPSGDISGRVSFEAFNLDNYTTTFDGGALTVDKVYTFTAMASTTDGTATSSKIFTITLDIADKHPYDNLYLRAQPTFDQRQMFNSIINNTEIFVPELIYRLTDPWFGISQDIEMLFLAGLTPSDLSTYANAMVKNHYTKTYNFDSINTAVVLDNNYNVKYEVVYINVVDPELNDSGNGPPLEINLNGTIENPYKDANGNTFDIVYPNSTQNMINRLASGVGYYDQSTLPTWMTSNQLGATSGTFNTPLGFTRAVVLAYTLPGASKLIAYRLRNSGINFNNIEFTADRYFLDNYYTSNFDINTGMYIGGRESTFDAQPINNIGAIVASVDYAVSIPFSQINGRPISYINNNGGLDGITNFRNGDTLIFVQQENFLNSGPFDGWVDYTDSYIGNNILTLKVEGYDSGSYDTYNVIPGYLQSVQSTYSFIGNTSIQSYQLSQIINNPAKAVVYVNGNFMPPSSYSIIVSTITFNSPLPNKVVTSGLATISVQGTTGQQSFLGDGTITAFLLSNSLGTITEILVNGITQSPSTYTITGTTLTFNSAPQPVYTTVAPTVEIINPTSTNERGGIWQISIVNDIVILNSIMEIKPNQKVRVSFGNNYSGAVMYYNNTLSPGQTVPYYSVFKQINSITKRTTFNGDSTKFFSDRDTYYAPGSQDKYVKFPQFGAFE